MTLKCVLVPIAGTAGDSVTMRIAVSVAELFSARIEVLYAHSLSEEMRPVTGRGFDPTVVQQITSSMQESAERTEHQVRTAFEDLQAQIRDENAKGYGVSAVLDVVDALPSDAVVERGSVFDLMVVGHPERADRGARREIAEAALFHTGRPVLIVPDEVPRTIGDRILIAWNRSAQAGRAVANAMPFLGRAKTVCIYYVETGAKQGPSPARLRDYLALHGIDAEVIEQIPDQRPVGEMLVDQTRRLAADMMVMGAYSKSRLRERVLGGVTDYIFSNVALPVLLAR